MKKIFALALGILTAIGGFVDIGDLVTNAVVGSRFGLGLAWVVIIGVAGICVYADMAGRVAAVSGRTTFEIIRERLGPRVGLSNLAASFLINLLTLTAEIGGIALALQLAAGVGPGLWIPVALFGVWIVIWRTKFSTMENVAGLLGLTLIVFVVALFLLKPDWGQLASGATQPWVAASDSPLSYWYFAVALFGAAMTPYEVFFFSSGAVEEKWTKKDLGTERANVFVGFPLGGILSLAIAGCAAVVLLPQAIEVTSLSQVVLPVAQAGGQLALAFVIVGILAATFGAALETTLSSGYTLAQFFGWSWGKFRKPAQAARFHVAMIVCLLIGGGVLATGVDPITVTELSVVFSAVALPLTYFPILVVANDPQYMGDDVNGRIRNGLGVGFLVIILVAARRGDPPADRLRNGVVMTRATKPQHPLEWYRDPDGRGVDAQLHLLDRQMIDRDGVPVSTVDDVELAGVELGEPIDHATPPTVSALLVGAAVLPRIFGGHMPRSRWDRIPWHDVNRLDTTVELNVDADDLDATWLERWFRDVVIARIPGGRHAPE